MLLAPIVLPQRASLGAAPTSDPAVREGVALGVGVGIVAAGAFASYWLYKHDQAPAAVVAGIGAIALGPRIASAII